MVESLLNGFAPICVNDLLERALAEAHTMMDESGEQTI